MSFAQCEYSIHTLLGGCEIKTTSIVEHNCWIYTFENGCFQCPKMCNNHTQRFVRPSKIFLRFWKAEQTFGNAFSKHFSNENIQIEYSRMWKVFLKIRSRKFARPSKIFFWGLHTFRESTAWPMHDASSSRCPIWCGQVSPVFFQTGVETVLTL